MLNSFLYLEFQQVFDQFLFLLLLRLEPQAVFSERLLVGFRSRLTPGLLLIIGVFGISFRMVDEFIELIANQVLNCIYQARIADLEQKAGRAMEGTGATPMRSNSYKKSRV